MVQRRSLSLRTGGFLLVELPAQEPLRAAARMLAHTTTLACHSLSSGLGREHRRPARHAPPNTRPAPSTSPTLMVARSDAPGVVWVDDLLGDLGLCAVAAAQRLGSAVDDLAQDVMGRVDQSVGHLQARLGDLLRHV
jgi:hypothetical protein